MGWVSLKLILFISKKYLFHQLKKTLYQNFGLPIIFKKQKIFINVTKTGVLILVPV